MSPFTIEFSRKTQSLSALREAAYRIIGVASCQIDEDEQRYVCHLTPAPKVKTDEAEIRTRFLDLVTDQNLRETISESTQPMRDLLVALAFGALAEAADTKAD